MQFNRISCSPWGVLNWPRTVAVGSAYQPFGSNLGPASTPPAVYDRCLLADIESGSIDDDTIEEEVETDYYDESLSPAETNKSNGGNDSDDQMNTDVIE